VTNATNCQQTYIRDKKLDKKSETAEHFYRIPAERVARQNSTSSML